MESIPIFVAVPDVILRLALDANLAGTTEAVSAAIQGAQLKVETIVSGTFDIHHQDCNFFLDSDAFSAIQPGGVFRLELPSGFIRTDEAITVTYGDDWNLTTPYTAATGSFKVDYKRGYILMDKATYADQYVRVQCTTGFHGHSVPNPPYPLTPTPAFDPGAMTPYDPDTEYQVGAAVIGSDDEIYVCNSQIQGGDPATGDIHWTKPTYAPAVPAPYNPTGAYFPTQVASLLIQGVLTTFICNVTTTPGTLPTNPLYFTQVTLGPEKIPGKLYEAIIQMVPSVFDSGTTSNRDSQATMQYKKNSDLAFSLLQDFIRMGKGFSFRPVD